MLEDQPIAIILGSKSFRRIIFFLPGRSSVGIKMLCWGKKGVRSDIR